MKLKEYDPKVTYFSIVIVVVMVEIVLSKMTRLHLCPHNVT